MINSFPWLRRSPLRLVLALLGLFASFALLVVSSAAYAAKPPGKSVVVYVEGPDSRKVRDELVELLPPGVVSVEPEDFTKALAKTGHRGQMGLLVTLPKQRGKLVERIRAAGDALGADGVLVGRVRMGKAGKEVWLIYVDPIPGDLAVDEAVSLRGNDAARRSAFEAALGSTLRDLTPPEPEREPEPLPAAKDEETSPDESQAESSEETPDRTPHLAGTSLFVLGADFQIIGRSFEFVDGRTGNLRSYDVFGAPMLALRAELYPLAGTGITFLRDLGLTGGFAQALGLESSTATGTPVGTTYRRFHVGMRARFRPGEDDGTVIGLGFGYGSVAFEIDADGDLGREAPSVEYGLVRLGVDGRFPMGPVALELAVGLLAPLAGGETADRFRDTSLLGVDASATFAIPITEGLEARLGAEYTRFAYSFSPVAGDEFIAGGALDQFISLRLGAAYVY